MIFFFKFDSTGFKKFIIERLSKTEKGLYRNLPLPGIFFMISSYGSLLVTLQRPPPEIFSFRPRPFSFQLIKLIYFFTCSNCSHSPTWATSDNNCLIHDDNLHTFYLNYCKWNRMTKLKIIIII